MNAIALRFDAPQGGSIVAVDDRFGKAYRCFSRKVSIGGVYPFNLIHMGRKILAIGDPGAPDRMQARVLAGPIHANTIRAIARRSKSEERFRRLAAGYWYEVLCD